MTRTGGCSTNLNNPCDSRRSSGRRFREDGESGLARRTCGLYTVTSLPVHYVAMDTLSVSTFNKDWHETHDLVDSNGSKCHPSSWEGWEGKRTMNHYQAFLEGEFFLFLPYLNSKKVVSVLARRPGQKVPGQMVLPPFKTQYQLHTVNILNTTGSTILIKDRSSFSRKIKCILIFQFLTTRC